MLKQLKVLLVLAYILSYSQVFATEKAMPAAKPATVATTALPTATVPATIKTAEETVKANCAACHMANGNSVISLNPKLAGQHPEYLLKQLTNFKAGTRANAVMSGIAGALSPVEMKDLANYFAKQTLDLGKAKSNGVASLGERIYRGGNAASGVPACASCHGANGAGLPKQFPRLGGQHADYTYAQLKTFRTGERANAPMMMTIAAKMTDAEMQAVADYMQGLR